MNPQQTIRRLQAAALDGHQAGQSWKAFFGANAGTITTVISSDPAGWGALRDRLLHALVTGVVPTHSSPLTPR